MDDETAMVAVLLASELSIVGVALGVVAGSLLGWTTLLAGYSVGLRAAALLFLLAELAIPLAVSVDLRRRPDDPDVTWLHAVSLPVINVFGVLAYIEERRRKLDASDESVD